MTFTQPTEDQIRAARAEWERGLACLVTWQLNLWLEKPLPDWKREALWEEIERRRR